MPTLTQTERDPFTCSELESATNMLRIEGDTLKWQRENDEVYAEIMATMWRMEELRKRIDRLSPMRTTSYSTNYR